MLTGVIGNLIPAFLFAIAIEKRIESSLAGILNSLTPLFVVVIGIVFFKLKIPPKKLVGVLIGFVGLFLLSVTRGPITVSDVGFTFLILLATICYGLNVNLVGTYLKGINAFHMATVSIAFLTIPAGMVFFWQPINFSSEAVYYSVAAAVLLGVLGSAAATALFYMLIKRAGGLFASLVTYAIPVVAIFWGLINKEQVGLVQVGCLGIILGGVYLANK